MKRFYLTLISILSFAFTFSQGYEFGIVHNTGYNFSVVAIPDFDGTNTDISDVGFSVLLPTGSIDITNLSQFNGRTWSATEATAAQLNSLSLGDGTKDLFVLNMPPGQTILSHTNGQQIVLLTFDITGNPTSGEISLLSNSDAIAVGLAGAADSFYNSNIDSTSTQDYFTGFVSGMESFMFSTLGLHEIDEQNHFLKLFPNPTVGKFKIESKQIVSKIEILNINGKIVKKYSKAFTYYNINNLSNGLYFVKIFVEGKTIVKKLIKK